jgi:aryl-alcohol dehydrogenase-like predicted oxidoreductase
MQKRKLGRDGPEVGAIGIGAMSFSDFYGATEDRNSIAVLDAAMELGMDHIDTSNVYGMGRSEKVIGAFLKDRGQEARDFFRIATKGGIRRRPDGSGTFFDNSPEHLTGALEESLTRLGVDCVDLYYVHRREADRPIEEVTETLAGLVRAGKTKAIGFSEISPASLVRANVVHPVAAVQSEYSLATRAPELGLIQRCEALGTALVAFSPVGRSVLSDAPLSFEAAKNLPFLSKNPRFMAPNYQANRAIADGFRKLAAETGVATAALAMAWLLSRGAHVLPIPGTRSVAHLRELAAGAEITLGAEDLARIDAVLPVGWAHGDRYSAQQWTGPERFS